MTHPLFPGLEIIEDPSLRWDAILLVPKTAFYARLLPGGREIEVTQEFPKTEKCAVICNIAKLPRKRGK